jgi:hypothetical protein
MIKKNTKVIFVNGKNNNEEEMVGGMPLSKGETVRVHNSEGKIMEYVVSDKTIDCFLDGKDQIVNIVYTLKRKS